MAQRVCRSIFAILMCAFAATAAAQWAWRDDSGKLVFSDQPPPAGVKPSQIVRQPAGAGSGQAAPVYFGEQPAAKPEAKDEPKKAAAAPPPGPKTLAEREMEARKQAQQRAEAEKKAAEEQTRKQQLAQDCERTRGYLRALEDGRRVARTDAQGNQVILDDAARAEEVARVRSRIASSCN